MAKFRLQSLAQLARQMLFTPQGARVTQLAAAEDLLHSLEPTKGYPPDFVTYRITGYRPKAGRSELLTGLALQHDLGLLIERVSASLKLQSADQPEPVLGIQDICERFNVTSKTVQRWRRRGLPARRFEFADGKARVGFLLSSVERFIQAHAGPDRMAVDCSAASETELADMVRHAGRLVVECGCTEDEVVRRIAGRTGRSPLWVRHVLRRHDREHPQRAVLAEATPAPTPEQRAQVLASRARGESLPRIAHAMSWRCSTVYRVLMDDRIERLARRRVRFIDDPLFHQPDAEAVLDGLLSAQVLEEAPSPREMRVPRDLPPYLADLYRVPLLTPARERALFLKLNYCKYRFVAARRRLDPELAGSRRIGRLEELLRRAVDVKNRIVAANLRLVVSVARRHVRPGVALMDLVSDGNIALMRAADAFDVRRGYRFSTYATWAVMTAFARGVPRMVRALRGAGVDEQVLANVSDGRWASDVRGMVQRDEVRQLLSRLRDRERAVLGHRYGVDGREESATYEALGRRLGLSKERVRQIEQQAIEKLRASVQ